MTDKLYRIKPLEWTCASYNRQVAMGAFDYMHVVAEHHPGGFFYTQERHGELVSIVEPAQPTSEGAKIDANQVHVRMLSRMLLPVGDAGVYRLPHGEWTRVASWGQYGECRDILCCGICLLVADKTTDDFGYTSSLYVGSNTVIIQRSSGDMGKSRSLCIEAWRGELVHFLGERQL
jgi:hypothetical protein